MKNEIQNNFEVICKGIENYKDKDKDYICFPYDTKPKKVSKEIKILSDYFSTKKDNFNTNKNSFLYNNNINGFKERNSLINIKNNSNNKNLILNKKFDTSTKTYNNIDYNLKNKSNYLFQNQKIKNFFNLRNGKKFVEESTNTEKPNINTTESKNNNLLHLFENTMSNEFIREKIRLDQCSYSKQKNYYTNSIITMDNSQQNSKKKTKMKKPKFSHHEINFSPENYFPNSELNYKRHSNLDNNNINIRFNFILNQKIRNLYSNIQKSRNEKKSIFCSLLKDIDRKVNLREAHRALIFQTNPPKKIRVQKKVKLKNFKKNGKNLFYEQKYKFYNKSNKHFHLVSLEQNRPNSQDYENTFDFRDIKKEYSRKNKKLNSYKFKTINDDIKGNYLKRFINHYKTKTDILDIGLTSYVPDKKFQSKNNTINY